jgi:hypothetical protein
MNRVEQRRFLSQNIFAYFFWLAAILCISSAAYAQQTKRLTADKTSSASSRQSSDTEEEEKFIASSRPNVANSAEFQKPGVLLLEYGYDANFRAEDFRSQQSAPLTLRFAASKRVLFDFTIDTFISEVDEMRKRETGVGDTRVGVQILALSDTEKHPALAFAYYVKAPTASSEKELGTGRTDHKIVALLSKKVGETDIDFNVAYLNVGREENDRRASGGQAALSFTREFKNNFGLIGEIAGQSEDDVLPRGIFALGAVTYKFNKHMQFDAGMRFGLKRQALRVGVFAGITVGVADFFKKK